MWNFKVSESITNAEYWPNSSRSDEHLKSIEIQRLSMISGLCIFHDLMNISSGSRIFQRLQRGHEHVITVSNVVARGYVFTGVCHSVHRGVCVADILPGRHPPTLDRHPPGQIPPGPTPPCPLHAGIHTPPAHCTTSSGSDCSGWYASERRWGVSLVLVPDPSMYLSYYTLLVLLLSYWYAASTPKAEESCHGVQCIK